MNDRDETLADLPDIGREAAIRGVRWHLIPRVERATLWREYARAADLSPYRARLPETGGSRLELGAGGL